MPFSEQWTFCASGKLFMFEYDDWDGSLVDIYAGIDYALSGRFSLGLGFNTVTFDLDLSAQNFGGNVDWGCSGGLIFLKHDC